MPWPPSQVLPDHPADFGVHERAVLAASLPFTISDPHLPDNPLVFVNPAFERITGWSRAEVLGRNCRFLQGPDTDPTAVQRLRDDLASGEHATSTLLNYRKDGTTFWNQLSISPVLDATGALRHYVGILSDVTSRVLAEYERQRHLDVERNARAAAEQAQRRLALLAEASTLLAATLDVDQALDRLTRLLVPLVADWCTVHLIDAEGEVVQLLAAHRDPDKRALIVQLEKQHQHGPAGRSHTARVLRGEPPVLLVDVLALLDQEASGQEPIDQELRASYRAIGVGSMIIVPLQTRNQVLGALTLCTDVSGRTFDQEDLMTAAELGRRAALAVDNARLFQRQQDVAEQLQRSLLPQLPQLAGLDRAARYLPGSTAAKVGGDWYDLFALPDGTVGIAVGDVMGHDLTAAASMGQLRSVLRSYAWQGSSPAEVLDRLDQLVQGLAMAQLATCIYGRIDLPTAGAPGRLQLCNAGHLPPVLRSPDGSVRLLGGPPSLLVGAELGTVRTETEEPFEPGTVLVLCTDGLIEHRGRSLDEGLAALTAALASAPQDDAEAICDHLLAELTQGCLDDDVALLVVRVLA